MRYILLYAFLFLVQNTFAQELHGQVWNQVFINTQISKKISTQTDAGLRFNEYLLQNNFQRFIRTMLICKLNTSWSLWFGAAYFETENQKWSILLPEWRPTQRIQWQKKKGKQSFVIRNRFEQRFRKGIDKFGNQTQFELNHRFAFQVQFTKLITEKSNFSLVIFDEVFLQSNILLDNIYFDQNRVFLGLQKTWNKNISLLTGPMYVIAKANESAMPRFNLAYRINILIQI